MAATIDISTDCARACARALTDAVADDTAPAAPELLMAMYAGAALAGVAAGTADAGGAGNTSRERATLLIASADDSRPVSMPPVASSCAALATRIERQIAAAEFAACSPVRIARAPREVSCSGSIDASVFGATHQSGAPA